MPNPQRKSWQNTIANRYPADWGTIQTRIIRRDKGVCQIQGPECTIVAREVDHIKPISRWVIETGLPEMDAHKDSNLRAVCVKCHAEKTKAESDAGRMVANPRPEPESAGWLDKVGVALANKTGKASRPRKDWFKTYGPMWELDSFGNYKLPEYTLGWQILAWIMSNLLIKGEPFVPTGEQARFILWAYAVDKNGKWVFTQLMKIAPKGWGKDPLLACIAAVEMIGPCRFGGWRIDEDGRKMPIAVDCPGAWFQIAAGNLQQAGITFEYLKDVFSDACRARYNVEIPRGPQIYAMGRNRRIEKLPSTAATKEGQFPTGAGLSELEHWHERNGLMKLFNTIKRNVKKVPGSRIWIITNAYNPGTNSQAQLLVEENEKYLNGRIKDPRRMIDAYMATEHAQYHSWDDRMYVLNRVYGESAKFVDLEEIAREFDSVSTPLSETLAFFFNCITTAANVWVDIRDWDACRVWGLPKDLMPPMGTQILLGFDGSLNDDATALMGMCFGGEYDGMFFTIGIWKPQRGVQVDREAIDAKVDWAFNYYRVQAFGADPSHKKDESDIQFWAPYIDRWHQRYSARLYKQMWFARDNAIKFDMASSSNNRLFVEALDKLQALITDKLVRQNGEEIMREHIQNARRVKKKGYDDETIGKESPQSTHKIDAAVCIVICYMLYLKLTNFKKPSIPNKGTQ